MRLAATLCLCALCATYVCANDSGDAPASYGLVTCISGGPFLGNGVSDETANPVSPAWTGDNDDGVIGTPVWTPGASNNSLTVRVVALGGQALLTLWVDANDDGVWSPGERYDHPQVPITQDANYTFSNIYLPAINFYRNGRDRVAIRLIVRDEFGSGGQIPGPTGLVWLGEAEDWKIPVTNPGYAIAGDNPMTPALAGLPFSYTFNTINGSAPYAWSMTSGSLPAGLALAQVGNGYMLSGTPTHASAGAGGLDYNFTLQCTCPAGVALRSLTLRVKPRHALPFSDDFSTDRGWTLGTSWQRGPAVAYTSSAGYPTLAGVYANEPGTDFTPGSSDNMILGDRIGADYENLIQVPYMAISPCVDCSGAPSVELRFMRWVGVGDGGSASGYDGMGVQVSYDGANWTTLWLNPAYPSVYVMNGATCDSGWTLQCFDISAVAANRPCVQVRFLIGTTDAANRYTGWCLDDVEIRATPDRSKLSATNLTINTPFTSLGLPLCYRNSTYAAEVTLSNSGTEAILVDRLLFGVQEVPQSQWDQISWHDTGVFTLATPTLIAAGAPGVVLSGSYQCTAATAGGSGLELEGKLFLSGTAQGSGLLHEAQATLHFRIQNSNAPGLYLFEEIYNGVPVPNGAAAAGRRDFGSLIVGQYTPWLRIAVRNQDSSALALGLPQISGATSDFVVDTTYYNATPGGMSTTYFDIRFAPASPGIKNATISLAHYALNTANPYTFNLRGTGVVNAPVVQVFETSQTGAQIANGAQASGARDFGQRDVAAGAGASLVICIVNAGTVPLVLGTPQLFGSGAAHFTLDLTGMNSSVAAASSTSFSLAFDPSSLGMHDASLRFTHNDTGTATPFEFFIRGEGIFSVPLISVHEQTAQGPAIAPGAAASGSRAFGALDVSSGASASITICVVNSGWVGLLLTTPTLTGANAGDFVLGLGGFSSNVAPGGFTSFTLAFDPVAKGPKSASVSFGHNDAAAPSPFVFALSGLGVDPLGVAITTTALPTGQDTRAYGPVLLAASGGSAPYTWAIVQGVTPAGLVLSPNGELSGVLTGGSSQYTFSVRVTDANGGTEDKALNLIVTPAPGALGKSESVSGCTTSGDGASATLLAALALLATAFLRIGAARNRRTAGGPK